MVPSPRDLEMMQEIYRHGPVTVSDILKVVSTMDRDRVRKKLHRLAALGYTKFKSIGSGNPHIKARATVWRLTLEGIRLIETRTLAAMCEFNNGEGI